MPDRTITLDDLRRVLREGAGLEEEVDLDGDILDTEFGDLGYDSIALLETASRLGQEYRIDVDAAVEARTPRELLDLVNAR
ncbi:MAG TPA: acyl carrier protein [Thermomonospora sp.]|nr:acyl carrier protein [Thermomonospora sp.]